MTAKDLIDKTARKVVAELKRADLIKDNRLGSFKKTEKALYEYPTWKTEGGGEVTEKLVRKITNALEHIKGEPYYELIELKYFKGWSLEKIAEYFGVNVSVISKRRIKLINQLRPIIFSDDFIRELIFEL